jgi:ribose transport system substrate-binding protein
MRKMIAVVVVLLLLVSVFTGCQKEVPTAAPDQNNPEQKEVAEVQKLRVGIVVKVLTGNSFQIDLANALKKAAEDLGLEPTVSAPQTFGDFAQQINIIEDLITKKVDLIVIAPVHATAISPALEKAKAAGIPVVTLDSMLENPDLSVTFVGPDNVKAGYEITKYLCEKMGGKGKFVHLEGEAGHAVAEWRKEGMLKALKEYPNVELVVSQNAHWSEEGGLEVMESALQAHPDVAGVFAANDNAIFGAIEACKRKGVRPVMGGFDAIPQALERVEDGSLDATVAFFPQKMAEASMSAGVAYIKYLKGDGSLDYFNDWVDSGATVITKDNLDSVK